MDEYISIKKEIDSIFLNNRKHLVNYFGVNIDENMNIDSKVYLEETSDVVEAFSKEPFYDIFKGKYWFVDKVKSKKQYDVERYELRLSLSTAEECNVLINNIAKILDPVAINKDSLIRLCEMEINDSKTRNVVPLYYIGIISKIHKIKAAKFHFMTRRIEKANTEYYDNAYYVGCLERLNCSEFELLAKIGREVLKNEYYNLHLIGVDHFHGGYSKYKVYFKIKKFSIQEYEDILDSSSVLNKINLRKSVKLIQMILSGYKESFVDGIAICLDNSGKWSVNIYFKFT